MPDDSKRLTPDTVSASKPKTLAEMFGDDSAPDEIYTSVAPPPVVGAVVRAARRAAIPSLQGLAPHCVLDGRGGTGKTLFARWMASELFERNETRFVMAALDPGVRLLAEFVENVLQPPTSDPREMLVWLRAHMAKLIRLRAPGVIDLGGGNTTWAKLVSTAPTIARDAEEAGVALVACYFFSTAPDDPALMQAAVQAGFAPKATLLVRNMNLADGPDAYNAVMAHPAYRAALDRGAVEIVIPRLEPQTLANRIESRRFHFFQARDGLVPEGSPHPPIEAGFNRTLIRGWMEAMAEEMRPVVQAGWMPWSVE